MLGKRSAQRGLFEADTMWAKLGEDGQTLFAYPMSVVVAHEAVIKGE